MPTFKQETISAFAWSLVDKFGIQVLSFGVGIVLARFYLSPSDYGLMGMLAIFIALSTVLLDSGFGVAIIRKQNLTQTELSSIYIFSIFLSLVLYSVLFFCSPLISSFYHQPILIPLCRISALLILINASTNVQYNLFIKELKFKHIAFANLIGLSISLLIVTLLARNGFGVWALVWQNIIFVGIRNIIIWYNSTWRPSLIFSFKIIKSFWSFSSRVMITGTLNTVFNNIFSLLIGRFYPLREVGYFSQANKFSDLSSGTITSTIQSVSYPILSQINNDEERLKRIYRKIVRVTSFLSFPILFGLAAVSLPLIKVLLTTKWISIVPYMQKLCIGGAFLPLVAININLLYVKGYSDKVLNLEIIRKAIIIICILCSINLGVSTLITGLVVSNILGFLLSGYFSGKSTNYKLFDQIKDIGPYFVIASVMAISMVILSYLMKINLILLLTQILLGAVVYFGTVFILGSKIFQEMLELLKINRK